MRVDTPITTRRTNHIVSRNIQSFYIQILNKNVTFSGGCILDGNLSLLSYMGHRCLLKQSKIAYAVSIEP